MAINLYNFGGDRCIPNAPAKKQCARDYLYGNDGHIERTLARIEGLFSPQRDRIMQGGSDPTDLRDLCFFTYLQLRRTASALEQLQLAASISNASPAPTAFDLIVKSLSFSVQSWHYIDDLQVLVIENRTDVDFVISDDPSLFTNRFVAEKLNGAAMYGVEASGLTMTMPLAPKLAIICYDRLVYTVPDVCDGRIVVQDAADVEALNELQFLNAAENVYFSRWEDRDYVQRECRAVKEKRPNKWIPIARDPGASASSPQILIVRPPPTRQFAPLQIRSDAKTFYGDAVGHVRREEWRQGYRHWGNRVATGPGRATATWLPVVRHRINLSGRPERSLAQVSL